MAKERLSKLQKWILAKCLKNKIIYRNEIKEYFGKEFPGRYRNKIIWEYSIDRFPYKNRFEEREDTLLMRNFNEESLTAEQINQKTKYYKAKEEYIITRIEERVISRSFIGLIKKGILIETEEKKGHKLTEKGFLKVDK